MAETPTPHEQLRGYMDRHGLKTSRQRDVIADVFFAAEGHLTVDELLSLVRKVDPRISQATVYRTVRLLAESGLAEARNFSDGQMRYEHAAGHDHHHDHFICTACGSIVEFVDERIEALQNEVAKKHKFAVTSHKLELYGLCSGCQSL